MTLWIHVFYANTACASSAVPRREACPHPTFLSLSRSTAVMWSLSSPLRVRPGALHCLQVIGESFSYSCSALQCCGAAEWGQCKPGLTLPTFWLTTGSEETLLPLFLLLLSRGASEMFLSLKGLFFAERLACVVGFMILEQVKQEMLWISRDLLM